LEDNDRAAHPSLPIESSQNGMRYICPSTVCNLLEGRYEKKFFIIDCRFDYEFDGGHIQDAINIKTEEEVESTLLREPSEEIMLVFHCEFSSHRAPRLYQYLRKKDRELHTESYPKLFYPELYVIQGGYKRFFEEYPELCNPSSYVPMRAKEHKEKLKENHHLMHTRAKVKRSWSTGSIVSHQFNKPNPYSGSFLELHSRSFMEDINDEMVDETEEVTHTTPTQTHRNYGEEIQQEIPLVDDSSQKLQFHC